MAIHRSGGPSGRRFVSKSTLGKKRTTKKTYNQKARGAGTTTGRKVRGKRKKQKLRRR